jgi:hypothetical protein
MAPLSLAIQDDHTPVVAIFGLINNAIEAAIESSALLQRGRRGLGGKRRKSALDRNILPMLAWCCVGLSCSLFLVINTAFKPSTAHVQGCVLPQAVLIWSNSPLVGAIAPTLWSGSDHCHDLVRHAIALDIDRSLSAYALTRLRWKGAGVFRQRAGAYLMPGLMMLSGSTSFSPAAPTNSC